MEKIGEKSQQPEEIIDGYITELRNLSSTCEFQDIRNGLMLYRLIDGIESNEVRDVLLRKGSNLKAIEYAEQMKLQKSNYKRSFKRMKLER